MIRILIQPAKSILKRRQWKFEIRATNGERLDPRDTFNNRDEASAPWVDLICGTEPVELVVHDRYGNVEDRRQLR